jgi:hypothetical protein
LAVRNPEKARFISTEIEVVSPRYPKRPKEFVWQGRTHKVARVVTSWFDFGLPAGSPRRANWRLRRHRKCFLVQSDDGRLYEICWDRSVKGGKGAWILSRAYQGGENPSA